METFYEFQETFYEFQETFYEFQETFYEFQETFYEFRFFGFFPVSDALETTEKSLFWMGRMPFGADYFLLYYRCLLYNLTILRKNNFLRKIFLLRTDRICRQ